MATMEKPMGPLPGKPGDFRKSPWFWRIVVLAVAFMVAGGLAAVYAPQHGGVLISVGFAGFALAAAIAAMTSLRSRRRDDEQLREAP
jgi:hypothetical protein